MRCPRCAHENSGTASYCESCGSQLGITCSACSHVNRRGSQFCTQCSAQLPDSVVALPSERLLKSLAETGGERKRLTVLFADIRNSTVLVGNLDPEIAMRRLQPALDCMKSAVDRYEGVVIRTQGDGIMAFFGAPRPHEDHAIRACLAALSMQDAVARLGDPNIQIRVGMHTGEVVVQTVKNTLYETFDGAGANIHLASRMEQMAEEGSILLTADTLAATRQFVSATSLGPRTVRGFSTPVEIFKLVGVRHAPASELFRSRPRLSPLVGRGDALNILMADLANTKQGRGRVVGVVGDAGVGKSRLCFEFAESCRRDGVRVYETRVLAHGRATPLQPILELLREYFGIKSANSKDEARQRVSRACKKLPSPDEALPLVLDLLGLAEPGQPADKMDPAVRRSRLIQIVRSVARSKPDGPAAVVLVEDLHWVDAASEVFIEALADAVVDTTTLLLLNFRPGFVAPWMQRSHYRQINAEPLAADCADDLLRGLLGQDPSLTGLCNGITDRAQGNPFFIEELIHSLIERGDLQGRPGAYRATTSVDAIPLPLTVEAVLAARIDRLDDTARQVLQSASVVGREISIAVLERVLGLAPAGVSEALWQLQRAELLYELPSHAQRLHAFRHPLIQEVAYRSLLHERRRALHGAVAAAIEAQNKEGREEIAALLAYHLEHAGEPLKAAQANMRAAIWIGAHDAAQAFRSWKKVLELLKSEPASQSGDYLRMMACGQIMNFGWREGMVAQEAASYFEEANKLALASNNMRASALIHAVYGRILAATGSADEYVKKIGEAEALVSKSDDASLKVTLKAVLCHALRLSGRMREALKVNAEATDYAYRIGEFDRRLLGFDVEMWLKVMCGQILVVLGRLDEARPHLDSLLQLDAKHIDPTHHVASVAYVDLAWAKGDARLADEHASRAFAIASKSGSPYSLVYARAARGLAHVVGGRIDAAIADLDEVLSFARERKAGLELETRILADLANAYRLKGNLKDAWHVAAKALDVARERCARVPACLAHIVRADVLLKDNREVDLALSELAKARALIAETGAMIYEPMLSEIQGRMPSTFFASQPISRA